MDDRLASWTRDPGDRWVDRFVVIVLLGLTLVGTLHFVKGHLDWSTAFAGDLLTWLGAPEIGGAPRAPEGLSYVLPVVALAAVAGWNLSRLLLANSDFRDDRVCRVALSVLLTCMLIGYVGTVAVVAGQLTRTFVVVAIGILAIGSTVARRRFTPAGTPRGSGSPHLPTSVRAFRAFVVVVTVTVLAFCTLHAVMRAVTEWDSIV
jgi:hypothetical protein